MAGDAHKLRRALEREEFVLHYQPKVDLDTRAVVGLEALLRWRSAKMGLVPPTQFIPALEKSSLVVQVGDWAMKRALHDQKRWQAAGLRVPRIAVNVSSIELHQRDFADRVEQAIASSAADPGDIELEITESRIMESIETNLHKLHRLDQLGVTITIDDFGTGYSSLAYLAKLPVHTLKIDRSFIATMLEDDDAMALVQMIISLAQTLKLTTVAEGVETAEQADMLETLRCDQMQGYLVSGALPFEEVRPLLAFHR